MFWYSFCVAVQHCPRWKKVQICQLCGILAIDSSGVLERGLLPKIKMPCFVSWVVEIFHKQPSEGEYMYDLWLISRHIAQTWRLNCWPMINTKSTCQPAPCFPRSRHAIEAAMLWTKIIDFGRRKDISEYGNATGYWEALGKHCSFEFEEFRTSSSFTTCSHDSLSNSGG